MRDGSPATWINWINTEHLMCDVQDTVGMSIVNKIGL